MPRFAALRKRGRPGRPSGEPEQTRAFHVVKENVVGKSLQELNLIERYRCVVTAIERNHKQLEPAADFVFQRRDIVEVSGQRRAVRPVADSLGRFEPSTHETDIAIYAGGILFGLLLDPEANVGVELDVQVDRDRLGRRLHLDRGLAGRDHAHSQQAEQHSRRWRHGDSMGQGAGPLVVGAVGHE